MTNEEIRDALIAACEGSAFVDVADEGAFILDGAFTLQQLVAIGDVARKALEQQGLSGALTEAVEQFGAERLANAPVEPKVGDKIRVIYRKSHFWRFGETSTLVRRDIDGDWWTVNRRGDECCLGGDWFEVIR